MDGYKKIFRTPAIRKVILNLFSFIPDSIMLKLQYKIKTGRKLNLKNPQRFTEKLQWYKINYKNDIMHKCVDKYDVRNYIKEKGLEKILVKLYDKCLSVDDISWDKLPKSFVIKTTNGGGGLNVVVCPDKTQLDVKNIKKKLKCKRFKKRTGGREWAYYGLEPGIIVEELLINDENPRAGITDYKFLCFSGIPRYIVVDVDRYIGHKRNFYDISWKNLHIGSDCPQINRKLGKPGNLEEMLKIAAKLSEDFPFVRVDLYSDGINTYFGELTFYPWSGYVQFTPDEFDFELGEKFNLFC